VSVDNLIWTLNGCHRELAFTIKLAGMTSGWLPVLTGFDNHCIRLQKL
jgi:hypothetical protein